MATYVHEPMRLDFFRQGGAVGVRVIGELDVAASPLLREALVELVDGQGSLSVVLDLQEMTFIDSTGIGVLVGALRSLRGKGGALVLANPRPMAIRVLEIAGLTQIFDIRLDEPEPVDTGP